MKKIILFGIFLIGIALLVMKVPTYQIKKTICEKKTECINKYNENTWIGKRRRVFIYRTIFPNGYKYNIFKDNDFSFRDFTYKKLYIMDVGSHYLGAHRVSKVKQQYLNLETKSQLSFFDIVDTTKSDLIKQQIKTDLLSEVQKAKVGWNFGNDKATPDIYRASIEESLNHIYENNGQLVDMNTQNNQVILGLSFCLNDVDVQYSYNFCTAFPAEPYLKLDYL